MPLIIPCETGNVSDGYHTFDELYEHRCMLFCALMVAHPDNSWWSYKHSDGSFYDGWIIAGINIPTIGPISYHLKEKYSLILPNFMEQDRAPEWDGHTSNDVIQRLTKWITNSF